MSRDSGRDMFNEDFFDDEDEDTQKDKFLTFVLGREEYGIEIQHVSEIIGMMQTTDVPDMPDFVVGVINLRGQIIPLVDVRLRFQMPYREYNDRTSIIVTKVNDMAIGLIVDTVLEVINILEDQISHPPKMSSKQSNQYIQGIGQVGEKVKLILDVNKILFDEEVQQLNEIQE